MRGNTGPYWNIAVGGLDTASEKVKVIVENWRLEYNNHRPHSGLDYMTPAAFAASCNPPGSATLRLPDCRIKNVDNSLIKIGT